MDEYSKIKKENSNCLGWGHFLHCYHFSCRKNCRETQNQKISLSKTALNQQNSNKHIIKIKHLRGKVRQFNFIPYSNLLVSPYKPLYVLPLLLTQYGISYTVEYRFLEPPRETKIGSGNREFEISEVKLQWNKSKSSSYRGFWEIEGSRTLKKSGFSV